MHIIGTAGHVDHGKSSLVLALTGTNPDRWLEERRRGMTLDLGFAHIRYDGVDAGIVDVPGHERFLHNMLAGAAGMELLMLVIALNEGVREQTIEHMQILQLLGIQKTIVVATKCDLVNDAGGAVDALRAQLRGTMAQDAAIVAVSSQTGEGIGELRAEIARALSLLPPRPVNAPVYLPVDRAFTLEGRGTVVTGTLLQGTLHTGESVPLQPLGRDVRIRSLHVFGESRDAVSAGSRVAANLAGVEREQVTRGDAIAGSEYAPAAHFRVRFTALAHSLGLLRRRTPVRVHLGAGETMGTLVFQTVPANTDPVRAELFVREALVGFPGLRFIVRRPTPKTLLGGGTIEGLETASESADAPSGVDAVLLALLRERSLAPTEAAQAAFLANLREPIAAEALARLVERGDAIELARPQAFLDAQAARDLLARIRSELETRESKEPWAMGTTAMILARTLDVDEAFLLRAIAAFSADGALAVTHGFVTTPAFRPSLTAPQQHFFEEALSVNHAAPNMPVPMSSVAEKMRHCGIAGISRAFDTLVTRGAIVRVGDELYRGTQIASMQRDIEAFTAKHGRFTVADFRTMTHTSRKYAVPLLEWFDARGITLRDGDYRSVRSANRSRTA